MNNGTQTIGMGLALYGQPDDLAVMKKRVCSLLTITTKDHMLRHPTEAEAALIVQFAFSIGANPFRDIHVWEGKDGKLEMTDDYTLRVRWAEKEMPFTPHYLHLTDEEKTAKGLNPKDEACYCYVLRRDHNETYTEIYKATLTALLEADIPAREAIKEAKKEALSAVSTPCLGIFKASELFKVKGRDRKWRAEVRALRGALSVSHRRPSPAELVKEIWEAAGTPATIEDWLNIPPDIPEHQREEHVKLQTETRKAHEQWEQMSPEEREAAHQERVILMRGEKEEGID
jgi:hypothetical protein